LVTPSGKVGSLTTRKCGAFFDRISRLGRYSFDRVQATQHRIHRQDVRRPLECVELRRRRKHRSSTHSETSHGPPQNHTPGRNAGRRALRRVEQRPHAVGLRRIAENAHLREPSASSVRESGPDRRGRALKSEASAAPGQALSHDVLGPPTAEHGSDAGPNFDRGHLAAARDTRWPGAWEDRTRVRSQRAQRVVCAMATMWIRRFLCQQASL